jgi:CHAD domain-containing protein
MLSVHSEMGTRFVADDDFELPPLTELMTDTDSRRDPEIAPAVAGEPVRQRLVATYFDTADQRLATAGLALRRRTGGDDPGWRLNVPAGSDARSEVRLPVGRSRRTVPTQLEQMVWARSLGAALQPVAESVTDRTVTRLIDATGQVVAQLADDRVTARRMLPTDGPGSAMSAATSWREIEVQLSGVDADLVPVVTARLRERGLRAASRASELASVLDPRPGGASAKSDGPKPTDRSSSGEAVLAHLREQVEQVRAYDLPVRLDAPDAVHKMRVATRRLRSALTTFKALFAADVVRPVRGELKWLAGELGVARDAEVMRDRVRKAVEADEEVVEAGSVAAVSDEELGQAYRSAHDRVLAELDGDRYHALLTALEGLVTAPPLRKKAAAPARKALPGLIARSFTDVRRIVEEAEATPAGAEREELLHDARKAAKRARYAGESVSGIFGADAVAFAKAMEEMQEALGEHQDSVLTRERLRDLALHTSSTDAAFFYGRLHALEEIRGSQSQGRIDAAWKAAGRKSLHRWLR